MINSASQFHGDVIGIDVGGARVGVARIHPIAKIAEPLEPILVKNGDTYAKIQQYIKEYQAEAIVFGLPRNLQGDTTDQTHAVEAFVQAFYQAINPNIPMYFIDEAGTSKAADERIKKGSMLSRDSVAAAILLEDFVALRDISPLLIEGIAKK